MKTISYNSFRGLIKEIVCESVKTIINEGISPLVWHFCPLNSMYYIAENDEFKCTPSDHNRSDQVLTSLPKQLKAGGERHFLGDLTNSKLDTKLNPEYNKIYNYYMCVSRTPYSRTGYQGRRRSEGGDWSCFCRIELDGYKLMSDFKGMPVNYFTNMNSLAGDNDIRHYIAKDKASKTKLGKDRVTQQIYTNDKKGNYTLFEGDDEYLTNDEIANGKRGTVVNRITHTQNGGQKIRSHFIPYNNTDNVDSDKTYIRQMSEYEDRIFSPNEMIPNFHKYIIRVDVLLSDTVAKKEVVRYELKKIMDYLPGKVFIYNNEVAFNSRNIRYSINQGKTNGYNNISADFLNNVDASKKYLLNIGDANNLGRYYGGRICNLFLKKISTGKRGFKGNPATLKDSINNCIKTLYPSLINALKLGEEERNVFYDGYQDSITKVLESKNMWSDAANIERQVGSRLRSIDACKNYLIKGADEIINRYFGIGKEV